MCFENIILEHTFHVLDMAQDAIVGSDFLTAHNVILDLARSQATLTHEGVQLQIPLRKQRGVTTLAALETDL